MKNVYTRIDSRTVLVIGDVMLDLYFMGEVRRISPEAPVPIVNIRQKTATLGGAGNVALNIAGLGSQPILVGIRGSDPMGIQIAETLKLNGIVDRLVVDPSRSTTTKTRIIGHGQQLLRLDEEQTHSASELVHAALVEHFLATIDQVDAVIISDYQKGVVTVELCERVISVCRSRKIPVFVDPRGSDWKRYRGATCVTPNTGELEIAVGFTVGADEELLVEGARNLIARHELEWLLVTRGPQGMCLVKPEGEALSIRATAREVYDVSGAGDTVIATLAIGIASGSSFPEAAAVANTAAGIVVGKLGSQAIGLAELETALRVAKPNAQVIGIGKITTPTAARLQIKAWQATGQSVVYANGNFDALDSEYIDLINLAKDQGKRLVLGVSEERSGKFLGSSPSVQQDRAYILAAIECVDLVVMLGDSSSLSAVIEVLRPDILAHTAALKCSATERIEVEKYGGRVKLIDPPTATRPRLQ